MACTPEGKESIQSNACSDDARLWGESRARQYRSFWVKPEQEEDNKERV